MSYRTTAKAGPSFSIKSLFVARTLSGYVTFLSTVKTISKRISLFTAVFMIMVWRSTFITESSTFVGWAISKNMLTRTTLEASFQISFLFFGCKNDFFFLLYFLHHSFFFILFFLLQFFIRINDVVFWILKGFFKLSEFMIKTFSFSFVLFNLFSFN